MLIFAKDITERDHQHSRESEKPALREYMEYQRKLFPYTVIRAGLDLAYKELDDILNYVDNGYRKPEGSMREEYPADVPEWVRQQFPWSGSFLEMEDLHSLLVILIKSMDSFRTWERGNSYHWAVLYDATLNIVRVYNGLLKTDPSRARDIQLSQKVEVDFEDFVNNYWPHLEFMILSQPDYAHTRLMERIRRIDADIKQWIENGDSPLAALDKAATRFELDPATLPLLRRDPLRPELAALETLSIQETPFEPLYQPAGGSPKDAVDTLPLIDAEYEKNFQLLHSRATA